MNEKDLLFSRWYVHILRLLWFSKQIYFQFTRISHAYWHSKHTCDPHLTRPIRHFVQVRHFVSNFEGRIQIESILKQTGEHNIRTWDRRTCRIEKITYLGTVSFLWLEVLTAVTMKMAVFWVVGPDDGGSTDLWNVGKLTAVYTALQPRRQPPFQCRFCY
jgi:hypothetical protein